MLFDWDKPLLWSCSVQRTYSLLTHPHYLVRAQWVPHLDIRSRKYFMVFQRTVIPVGFLTTARGRQLQIWDLDSVFLRQLYCLWPVWCEEITRTLIMISAPCRAVDPTCDTICGISYLITAYFHCCYVSDIALVAYINNTVYNYNMS